MRKRFWCDKSKIIVIMFVHELLKTVGSCLVLVGYSIVEWTKTQCVPCVVFPKVLRIVRNTCSTLDRGWAYNIGPHLAGRCGGGTHWYETLDAENNGREKYKGICAQNRLRIHSRSQRRRAKSLSCIHPTHFSYKNISKEISSSPSNTQYELQAIIIFLPWLLLQLPFLSNLYLS